MHSKKLVLALAISLLLVGSARAGLLVNTGQPANTTGGMSLHYPQTLLGQFVLQQPATITAIQGWVNVTQIGSMRVLIYRDNGDVPGDLVNAQLTTVASTGTAWVGPASLNWPLQAGTYWVGFFGSMTGFNGTMPGPAPAPLGKEGYISVPGTPFVRADDMNIGVKISGNPIEGALMILGD